MAPYRPLILLFLLPIIIVLTYRCVIEAPTYFWECKKADLETIETSRWKYGVGVSVSYKVHGHSGVVFNRIAPIAIDQDSPMPIYPYRYYEKIGSKSSHMACVSSSGNDAVLAPGFSKETFYYLCIFLFFSVLFVFSNKKDRNR